MCIHVCAKFQLDWSKNDAKMAEKPKIPTNFKDKVLPYTVLETGQPRQMCATTFPLYGMKRSSGSRLVPGEKLPKPPHYPAVF